MGGVIGGETRPARGASAWRLVAASALSATLADAALSGDRRPVAYEIVDSAAIPAPLVPGGDATRGAALAADPAGPGCLACHEGREAPRLDGIGARRDAGRLRLAIVNLGVLDPDAADHDFYHPLAPGEGPEDKVGETRLTALDVEDLVSWLVSLRDDRPE